MLGLFLVKPQILEKRRLKTVVRLIEDEGFQILDMCLLQIQGVEFEAFMHRMKQGYEPVEVTLYSQGRSALFAVSHRSDEFYVHGGRVEQGSKARFFPGDDAVETWFGKLSNKV
jgi:nucleoside diphosphate kinase